MGSYHWIIFCDEKVWVKWLKVCMDWLAGTLPDSQGHVFNGKDKKGNDIKKPNDRVISSSYFRDLEGDIPQEIIFEILEKVLKKEVLLTKSTSKNAKLESWPDVN